MEKIRNFEITDIREASSIAYEIWSPELEGVSERVKKVIYEYLVRYYYTYDTLSFSLLTEDKVKAFILTDDKIGANENANCYLEEQALTLTDTERKYLYDYKKYLDYNQEKVREKLVPNSVCVELFASVQKGAGSKLLNVVEGHCIENGVKYLYLWTDATCNYQFYDSKGYKVVDSYEGIMDFNGEKTVTFIYRKELVEVL